MRSVYTYSYIRKLSCLHDLDQATNEAYWWANQRLRTDAATAVLKLRCRQCSCTCWHYSDFDDLPRQCLHGRRRLSLADLSKCYTRAAFQLFSLSIMGSHRDLSLAPYCLSCIWQKSTESFSINQWFIEYCSTKCWIKHHSKWYNIKRDYKKNKTHTKHIYIEVLKMFSQYRLNNLNYRMT